MVSSTTSLVEKMMRRSSLRRRLRRSVIPKLKVIVRNSLDMMM